MIAWVCFMLLNVARQAAAAWSAAAVPSGITARDLAIAARSIFSMAVFWYLQSYQSLWSRSSCSRNDTALRTAKCLSLELIQWLGYRGCIHAHTNLWHMIKEKSALKSDKAPWHQLTVSYATIFCRALSPLG